MGVKLFATGEVGAIHLDAQRLVFEVDLGRAERKQIPAALEESLVVDDQIAHAARRRVDHDPVEASDADYPMTLVSHLDAIEPGKGSLDLCGGEVA